MRQVSFLFRLRRLDSSGVRWRSWAPSLRGRAFSAAAFSAPQTAPRGAQGPAAPGAPGEVPGCPGVPLRAFSAARSTPVSRHRGVCEFPGGCSELCVWQTKASRRVWMRYLDESSCMDAAWSCEVLEVLSCFHQIDFQRSHCIGYSV